MLSGPLKGRDVLSEDSVQEVAVNFIAQDSVALDRANLDREVSRLWDLDSLGIKSGDEVHESFENEIEFWRGGTQSSCHGNKVMTPFHVISKTVCHA